MTICEAMEAVNNEYNDECLEARRSPAQNALMAQVMGRELVQIDQFLPEYVAEIATAMKAAPPGTALPDYVYQTARMCFRLGMRVQRKINHPEEASTIFWESGAAQ
jgi:hypothetical protein